MSIEDPNAFLFEFAILCRSYNYTKDAQKLKLFLATLKDAALRWFMGLGEYTIRTWDQMKSTFLKKYQDYCKSKDSKNDIFKIQQSEEEMLDDYLERFLYNYQKYKQRLNHNIVRTIFLKGILDEYINTLNLMGARDISQFHFEEISKLCRKYSCSKSRYGRGLMDTRVNKSASGGVTRIELGNLLEKFKTDILGTLSSQLDTIKVKNKQEEENPVLSIFCLKCSKRHPLKECSLNTISICGIRMENHSTEDCPLLPRLQVVFKQGNDPIVPPLQPTQ